MSVPDTRSVRALGWSGFRIVLAAALLAAPAGAQTVSTLAGSGRTGNADGPSAAASFMLPAGLAYDRSGNLLVADAAGQRIRIVRPSGEVATLAGGGAAEPIGTWVPGGHTDGRGPAARFNRPFGIAVTPDGSVFVADTFNNCIRRIAPNGTTTTWVGSPGRPASAPGPRATAALGGPVGLASDRAGNLYASARGGIFKIAPNGTVSAVGFGPAWSFTGQLGVAAGDGPGGPTIYVADISGIYAKRADGTVTYFRNARFQARCAERAAACAPQRSGRTVALANVGSPLGLTALSDHVVAYTDVRSDAVRMLDIDTGAVRRLAGSPYEDGSGASAGYRDGPGDTARFSGPAALAVDARGRFAVADSGNRRLRAVTGVDQPTVLTPGAVARFRPAPRSFTVAYAGNAAVAPVTAWPLSAAGSIETLLRRRDARATVVPLVLADEGADPLPAFERIAAGARRFDAVVLVLTSEDVAALELHPGRAGPWQARLTGALRAARARLTASRARLSVLVLPDPADVAPAEALWARLLDVPSAPGPGVGAAAGAIRASGAPVIDVSAAFAAEARAARGPLFAALPSELNTAGTRIVADAVARALEVQR